MPTDGSGIVVCLCLLDLHDLYIENVITKYIKAEQFRELTAIRYCSIYSVQQCFDLRRPSPIARLSLHVRNVLQSSPSQTDKYLRTPRPSTMKD